MHKSLIIIILSLLYLTAFPQKENISLFEKLKQQEKHYDNLFREKEGKMEGTGFKEFSRSKKFLTPRFDRNGSLENYVESRENWYKKQSLQKSITYMPADWVFLGPMGFPQDIDTGPWANNSSNGKGMITSIWVNPTDHDKIYAGAGRGGLWHTEDRGNTWVLLTGDEYNVTGIEQIIVTGSTIYLLCTMYGIHWGIARSTNGGESFEFLHNMYDNTGNQMYPTTESDRWPKKLAIDPDNSDILYFLTYKAIFKSENGGDTWSLEHEEPFDFWNDGQHSSGFYDLKILDVPGTINNVVYVSGRKILRHFYTDNNWNNADITTNVISTITPSYSDTSINKCLMAIDEAHYPGKLWFAFQIEDNICTVKGTNSTSDITQFQYISNSHTNQFSLGDRSRGEFCISPTNESIIYFGDIEIWKFDGINYYKISDGKYWTHVDSVWVHVDVRDMQIFEEYGMDVLFSGDDGGVTRSTSAPASGKWSWEKISDDGSCGLYVTEFYSIASSEKSPELIAGGCQDLASFVYDNGNWFHTGWSDGGQTLIDPEDPSFAYMMHYTDLFRHNNRGKNTDKFLFSGGMYSECVLQFDPGDHTTIYYGYNELTKIENTNSASPTISITCSSSQLGGNKIIALGIAPGNPDIMHVFTNKRHSGTGAFNHQYLYTNNGGSTWSDRSASCGIPFSYNAVWAVTINPNNDNELWIGLSYSDEGKTDYVYRSTNGGTSFTALNTSGYPAGIPVNDLEYDHVTNRLYAATDVGLFITQGDGDGWKQYSGCVPYGHFTDIEINYNARKIRAAVFGYGLWEASLQFCPAYYNRTLSGLVTNEQYYEAQNTIYTTQATNAVGKLKYVAQKVVLNPGFFAGELEVYPRLPTCNAECEEGCQ